MTVFLRQQTEMSSAMIALSEPLVPVDAAFSQQPQPDIEANSSNSPAAPANRAPPVDIETPSAASKLPTTTTATDDRIAMLSLGVLCLTALYFACSPYMRALFNPLNYHS